MRKGKLIGLIILGVMFFLVCGYALNRGYSYYIKSHKLPMYYYLPNSRGNPNPALYITDMIYKDSIILYYDKVLGGNDTAVFNFPINGLSQNDPVYLLDFTSDSTLAKIICYTDNIHVTKQLFVYGWVDVRLLHGNPPAVRK